MELDLEKFRLEPNNNEIDLNKFKLNKPQEEETIKPKQGILSRIAERTKGVINRRAEKLGEISDAQVGKKQSLLESAFQTAGTAIGGLGEIGFGVVAESTPEAIKKPLLGALEKAAPIIEPVMAEYEEFAKTNPRLARNITASLETLEVLPVGGSLKAIDKAVESIGKTTYKGFSQLGDEVIPIIKQFKKAPISNAEEAGNVMYKIIRPTQGEVKKMTIKRGKNINDITTFMAKEKTIPDVTPDKKMDWKTAIDEQTERLVADSEIRTRILANADANLKTGDWNKVIEATNKQLEDVFKNADELEEAKSIVAKLIEKEVDRFGDTPKPSQISRAVQGMWQVGYRSDSPLKHKVSRIIGHHANDMLDDIVPDPRLRELTKRMGLRLDSIALMENATGRVIQSGRIGQYFGAGVGAIAGSVVPVVGPIFGGIAGKKAVEYLAKTAPKRAAKKAIKLYNKSDEKFINELMEGYRVKTAGGAPGAMPIGKKLETPDDILNKANSPKAPAADAALPKTPFLDTITDIAKSLTKNSGDIVKDAQKFSTAEKFIKAKVKILGDASEEAKDRLRMIWNGAHGFDPNEIIDGAEWYKQRKFYKNENEFGKAMWENVRRKKEAKNKIQQITIKGKKSSIK